MGAESQFESALGGDSFSAAGDEEDVIGAKADGGFFQSVAGRAGDERGDRPPAGLVITGFAISLGGEGFGGHPFGRGGMVEGNVDDAGGDFGAFQEESFGERGAAASVGDDEAAGRSRRVSRERGVCGGEHWGDALGVGIVWKDQGDAATGHRGGQFRFQQRGERMR